VLETAVQEFLHAYKSREDVMICWTHILPQPAYVFPWSLPRFFGAMPETITGLTPAITLSEPLHRDADLVIFAYTVWFVSPSLPVQAFLKSHHAEVLRRKKVITLVVCRSMWRRAQRHVKSSLEAMGCKIIDRIVVTFQGNSISTYISTLAWLLGGQKKISGVSAAGASQGRLLELRAQGFELENNFESFLGSQQRFSTRCDSESSYRTHCVEAMAAFSFPIWAKLILRAEKISKTLRSAATVLFVIYLVSMIVALLPTLLYSKFDKNNL
jgi:hypothetical protein